MAKQREAAHAELDRLRQDMADERVKARDAGVALDAAKVKVDECGRAVTNAYALEDAKLAAQRRKELQAAEAAVLDLQHRVDAAQLRAERAQQQLDSFHRDNANALIEERVPAAREAAMFLTRLVHEVVRAHQAYVAMRMEVDGLVAGVPDAVPRLDGVTATYAWERELKELARAVRETPEVEVPAPRWAGLEQRQLQDNANRFERLRRKREPTDEEHAINQEVA